MFYCKRTGQVKAPRNGFTSYVSGQAMSVGAAADQNTYDAMPAQDVDYTDNVQHICYNNHKTAVVLVVAGVLDREFTSNIAWFGGSNVRAAAGPNARRARATGVQGNLNKFCLPFYVEGPYLEGGVLQRGVSFPRNEGPQGELWETAQNISCYLRENYLNYKAVDFFRAFKHFIKKGATLSEVHYVLAIINSVIGQSSLLANQGSDHARYHPHTVNADAERVQLIGYDANNAPPAFSPNVVRGNNTVRATRTDLLYAYKAIMNAVGMRAQHSEDLTDITRAPIQYTLGTMRGLTDFALEFGFAQVASHEEWEGMAVLEPRALIASFRDASRMFTFAFDKACQIENMAAHDVMEFAHTARNLNNRMTDADRTDLILEAYQKSQSAPIKQVEEMFQTFFPHQANKSSRRIFFAEERIARDYMAPIRTGYKDKALARVPRRANPLFDIQENKESRLEFGKLEMSMAMDGVTAYFNIPSLQEDGNDKSLGMLSQMPFKYRHAPPGMPQARQQTVCEFKRAQIAIYKNNVQRYEVSLQVSGTEDVLTSLSVALDHEAQIEYGVNDEWYLANMKQFIASAGFGTLMQDYQFIPVYTGVEQEVKFATLLSQNYIESVRGIKRIITTLEHTHMSADAKVLARTVEYGAHKKQGFTT
nr:putative coat protein [Rhizoctonia zeae megatotivirus 1]